VKPLSQLFDFNTPAGRARLFRLAWILSLGMLVLGYLIIVLLLFF
jgi:hypothetical protein